jgi:mediator of RNA polymerase II transcription subunit 16
MDSNNIEEPAMVDAAMMDPTMEDLFGDAADGLNGGMASAPLPASLILRIAEMQSRGCCG